MEAFNLGSCAQLSPLEDVMVQVGEDDGMGSGGEEAPYEKPEFAALTPKQQGTRKQFRRVPVPAHRLGDFNYRPRRHYY